MLITRCTLLHHPTPTAHPSKILAAFHENLSLAIQVCISREGEFAVVFQWLNLFDSYATP